MMKTQILFTRRHKILMLSIVIVLIVGISSRVLHTGFPIFDEYLGDALYAALFYLLLSLIWEKGTPLAKASRIVVLMIAIETFQLTLIPLRCRFKYKYFSQGYFDCFRDKVCLVGCCILYRGHSGNLSLRSFLYQSICICTSIVSIELLMQTRRLRDVIKQEVYL